MKACRGQSLLELALCLPVVLLLGLGTAAVVQVVDANAGLRAAAEAAVSAAARAADPDAAAAVGESRFKAVIADYPVRSPTLQLLSGDFTRGSVLTYSAAGFVDVGWESLALVPAHVEIRAQASMQVEPWRTHR